MPATSNWRYNYSDHADTHIIFSVWRFTTKYMCSVLMFFIIQFPTFIILGVHREEGEGYRVEYENCLSLNSISIACKDRLDIRTLIRNSTEYSKPKFWTNWERLTKIISCIYPDIRYTAVHNGSISDVYHNILCTPMSMFLFDQIILFLLVYLLI